MAPELSVVMPAHNEASGLRDVVAELQDELESLVGVDRFEIVVVDDASTDATADLLDELARHQPTLRVLHLADNVGHGPALRRGLETAQASWVVLLDADGEIPASALAGLWKRRDEAPLVLGVRAERHDGAARAAVTAALRLVVRVATRRPLRDANAPCKVVRRDVLQQALGHLPPDAFAPSVLLVVAACRAGVPAVEVEVPVRPSPARRSWLVPTRLARGCAGSVVDAVRVARRVPLARP